MAKLTGKSSIGGRRDQALGPAYRVSMWRGIPRVYAKQLAKKKKISPKQAEAMKQFAALANVAKYITPDEYDMAVLMSTGTQYLWRDLVYMTYSGRLFNFSTPDGKRWFSVAARTTSSDILDVISQEPGVMLYRGAAWWEEIPPGAEGEVLTFGADGRPYWAPGGGGGGKISWFDTAAAISTYPGASQGFRQTLATGLIVEQIGWRWAAPAIGTVIRADIFQLTGTTLGALMATTGDKVLDAQNQAVPLYRLSPPAILQPDTQYATLITRRSGSPSTTLAYGAGGSLNPVLIPRSVGRLIHLNSINPVPGNTVVAEADNANGSGVGTLF